MAGKKLRQEDEFEFAPYEFGVKMSGKKLVIC